MERGHRVTLSTHAEYDEFLAEHGVEAGPRLRGSFKEILASDLGRRWLASADSPREYGRYARELFVPLVSGWCEDADAAVEGADAALFYAVAHGAAHAVERRRMPSVALTPWPMVPSSQQAPLIATWLDGFPGFVKRWVGHKTLEIATGDLMPEVHRYRERVGLPRLKQRDPMHHLIESGITGLHVFSEHVVPRPTDWPERFPVSGFPFLPARAYTPPPALEAFLANGPTPIYIGFGSMTGMEPRQLAELAVSAVRRAGVRAVMASGWAGLQASAGDDVYVIDECPHDWLFPRVSAVVHHGGVGTFHEGLRAGKPTVIAAFFADQTFWGWRNEKLGTGPRALRRKTLTADTLARAIRAALDGPHRARAETVGAALRAENGAARAAAIIESTLRA
jgi:sterol 3beta-glucosyltransferase